METNPTASTVQIDASSRTLTMTLRVNAEERKRIRANAKAQGLTVSDYLRAVGLSKPEHDLDAVVKLLRELMELHDLQGQVQQREVVDAVATGYRLIQNLILADQPALTPEAPTRVN